MLKFFEFMKENFLAEAKKAADDKSSSEGGDVSHRGTLNEMAFVHAVERYNSLFDKHKGNHEKAIRALALEKHLGEIGENPYSDKIRKIEKSIGKEETDRTLWDSHHAAIAFLNHIHKTEGGITGPAYWTGPDTSGKTVEKLTGVNTNADILIPTGSGKKIKLKHASLKYSKDLKKKGTKLFQGTARQAAEHIQDHHVEHFGKRDAELDAAVENIENTFGDVGERLEKHAKKLKAAGFQRAVSGQNKGKFVVSKITNIARYASDFVDGIITPDRKLKLEQHFINNKIPKSEWSTHIKNLAKIHKTVVKGDKVQAARDYSTAFTKALNKSFTKAKGGQHDLVRKLTNIKEGKLVKVMVVKTQRNSKVDRRKDPVGALPRVSYAIHADDMDNLFRKAVEKNISENNMYRQVKDTTKENASSTIATATGDKIASTSIDTAKGSPSLVIQAGNFENYNDVSHLHPLHPDYSPDARAGDLRHPEERGSGEHGPQAFSHRNDPTKLS